MSKQIQTYSDLIKFVFPLNGLFNVQRKRTNDGLCNEFTVFHTFQMKLIVLSRLIIQTTSPFNIVDNDIGELQTSSLVFMFP